jgi:hypothetical protein
MRTCATATMTCFELLGQGGRAWWMREDGLCFFLRVCGGMLVSNNSESGRGGAGQRRRRREVALI